MELSSENINLDSDEESPLTLSQSAGAKQSFQFEASNTSVPKPKSLIVRKLQNSALHSVYVVLFKAKINVLLPFGPLAVLLHYVTGSHVRTFFLHRISKSRICSRFSLFNFLQHQGWVFFFSLLGITPLAERLGYATEYDFVFHLIVVFPSFFELL